MKRIVLFITAVLLFAGCAKEQLVEERSYTGPVTVVSATFESLSNGATKAAVTDAGIFTWQNGDKAAFTVASGSSYLTGTNSSTTATAVFSINGSPSFTSSSFAFYPSDLTSGTETSSLAVKVLATREWVKDQTNVAMYGAKVENEASFNFTHMGGLVRVRVNNVPTNARKFVFRTPGYKINGEFNIASEGGYNVIKTATSSTESEQTYTLTWETAPSAENTMDFYIPLPLGTYANGFSFKFLDGTDAEILSKTSSQSETIARKDLVLMPAITLMGGEIEPAVKAAVVQEVPAGHSGDFLLANSEKVLLKVNASEQDKDITLKYNGGDLPTNLEIQVVGGKAFDKTISGDLPKTHVDFTTGEIAEVEMTTSSSTFAIIYPAKISTKLTVKGGNVKIKGATVQAIEVDSDAVADSETGLPVQIAVEKYTPEGGTAQTPDITEGITANASIVVAPDAEVTVNVQTEGDVQVAKAGEGSVTGVITTDAKAKIGENNYFTLADAVKAAPKNATEATTITLLDNVTDGAGIFLAAADKKNIIINLNDKTYTAKSPAVGSDGYKTQAFHFEKDNTVVIKNGEINIHADNKDKTWSKGSEDKGIAMIIQNYANLTLVDMTIDATNIAQKGTASTEQVRYAVSTNHGSTTFAGKTKIITVGDDIAFDSCDGTDVDYPGKPTVTWSCSDEGSVTGGIELSGGKFVVEKNLLVSAPVLAAEGESTLEIGTDATLSPAVNFSDPNPNISNHATGTAPVQVKRGASLTICGDGAVDSKSVASAVIVTVKGDDSSKTAKLTVNGKVTLQGKYYGISGNGDRQNTEVTINGGTIKGTNVDDCAGIYNPQRGSLTINGGTIEGAVGIYVKAGDVTTTTTGGTIKGIGTKATFTHKSSGVYNTGDAFVVENCGYPGGTPNVNISGGTFISTNASAVASYAYGDGNKPISGFIHGGTFSDESAIKYAAKDANITIKLQANRTAGTGVFVKADQNQIITFDLNGYNFAGVAPAVGSQGTENQLFHIERNNNFTLTNSVPSAGGRVSIDENNASAFRFIIMDYAVLTLNNVTLDGTNLGHSNTPCYTLSTNYQNVTLQGNTSITAKGENVAFDAYAYLTDTYPTAPIVTWNSTGNVDGIIELTGGKLSLNKDLCINAPIFVKTNNQSTLELNGKKVYNTSDIWEKGPANKWFELIKVDGGILKINDTSNGSVAAKQNDCYAVNVINEGVLEINGGTFKGNVSAVQVDKGTATIKAGSFEQQQGTQYDKYLLNCVDANYKAGTAKIIVKGGSFKGFNPADNAAEGAGTNFVAEGYTSTENNGVWTVSAKQN